MKNFSAIESPTLWNKVRNGMEMSFNQGSTQWSQTVLNDRIFIEGLGRSTDYIYTEHWYRPALGALCSSTSGELTSFQPISSVWLCNRLQAYSNGVSYREGQSVTSTRAADRFYRSNERVRQVSSNRSTNQSSNRFDWSIVQSNNYSANH